MFDAIARRYDALNRLLSAGLDRRWRRRAVEALQLTGRERVLDMCTGTADLAIAAVTGQAGRAREVVGVDFSSEMLRHGLAKTRAANLQSQIRLVRGDATRVPLPDAACDGATVAFGIRNVADADAACREFRRVLRPGGTLVVLEFGAPSAPILRAVYLWYFRRVLPLIGRAVSSHGEAYAYLPASVLEFPTGEAFAEMLRRAGFTGVVYRTMTFGIVYLYVATVGVNGEATTGQPSA
jgi:demethylmenaquinone methyltransferase/2-methoxy-6-polyprenyl-1,4-benzoquinol methylase